MLHSNNPSIPNSTSSIHWLVGFLSFLLVTAFGYRTVLFICFVSIPFYFIGLVFLLILFNLASSYWIEYQASSASLPSIHQSKQSLYDHLSFATPAAYSAAFIKKTWENQVEWRKQPLHPLLKPKTVVVLDRLITKIIRDFVWKWYNQIVPPPYSKILTSTDLPELSTSNDTYSSSAFPLSVEKTIRHSLRIIFERLGNIDLANLIVHQVLPILTTHVEAFRQAEYDLRGAGLPDHGNSHSSRTEPRGRLYRAFFSSGNDEIDLLLSRLHADVLRRKSHRAEFKSTSNPSEEYIKASSGLHPAVDVPTPNSQSAEQAHLRKLLEHLLPIILPESESNSPAVKTLVIELLTCSVIAPIIDILSDPDFWNRFIEERAGDAIREQRMVEQLRRVLDQQLSFVTGSSKMETSASGSSTIASSKPQTATNSQTKQQTPPTTIDKNNGVLDHEFSSTESISIKTTAKEFERFSRSIQRCNTLFDVRRLKNDVETQIRKTEAELISRCEPEHAMIDKTQIFKNSQDPNALNLSTNSQNDLKKFLERLSAVRDILDHRLVELGGSSGPVHNSWSSDVGTGADLNSLLHSRTLEFLHRHQPNRKPNQILQEILRDRESPALSYFTEFMDRRQRVKLIQFWLAVEGLKNPLEEDPVPGVDRSISVKLPGKSIYSKSYSSSIHEIEMKHDLPELDLDSVKADIQAIVEINFSTVEATELLGFKTKDILPLLRFVSPHLAKMYDSALPTQPTSQSNTMNNIYFVKEARAALFSMQRQVFDLMLAEDFPAFAASGDLYLRATASLRSVETSDRSGLSPAGLVSVDSFPNIIDHNKALNLKAPGMAPKYQSITKPRHLSDLDSLRHIISNPSSGSQLNNSFDYNKRVEAPLVRAKSFSGYLPLIDSQLSPEHIDERPQSAKSQDAVKPIKGSHEIRKSNQSTSRIIQTLLRSNSTDTSNYRVQMTPSPVPPQVTFQEAFDERPPGQRLTGDIQYDQHLFTLSDYNFPGQSSSSQSSSLKFHPPDPTDIHPSKFQMLSPSLDFLISPCKGDRAPLFEDDLNFSIQNANPRHIQSKSESPTSRLGGIRGKQREPMMSSDANIALQEALSSIISTSDQITTPSKHEQAFHSFHSSTMGDESGSTHDLRLENPNQRNDKLGLKPLSDSTLSSPISKPSQRKRLFDDDGDEDDEDDDDEDGDVLLLLEPNKGTAAKRRKQVSPSRGTIISTPVIPSTSSTTISSISDANERILKLENELNLLSTLMRRAELTGNKLEIRLVKKSIESVGKELSEVVFRKSRLIEQREISLGGFRGKLVPGRVKISITGTTIGGSQNQKQTNKQNNTLMNNNSFTSNCNIGQQQQEYVLYRIEVHKLSEDASFGSGWIVYRRYSEFNSLHKTLKDLYPISRQLDFPTKPLFGLGISTAVALGATTTGGATGQVNNNKNNRPNVNNNNIATTTATPTGSMISSIGNKSAFFNLSFIEQRRSGLERYLKALIQIPVLCESPELAKFLSRSKNQQQQQHVDNNNNRRLGIEESISNLKKRIEFFSNTSGFMRSVYNSFMTPSTTSSNTAVLNASSNGSNNHEINNKNKVLTSHEADIIFSPILPSCTTDNSHHSHNLSNASSSITNNNVSFTFSSQSLLDCLTKGFNSSKEFHSSNNLKFNHQHKESLDGFASIRHLQNDDSIEFNELDQWRSKTKLSNLTDDVNHNENENEETVEIEEEEFSKGLLNLTQKFKPITPNHDNNNNNLTSPISASTITEAVNSELSLLNNFTKPISDFLIEIFELNRTNHWIRKHGVIIILQQILGGTIERKLRESISDLLDDDHLSQMINNIEESIWIPDNFHNNFNENNQEEMIGVAGELRPKSIPRSIEEKLLTCEGAYRKLSVIIPDYAASILGRSNARIATRRAFSMIQNRRLNKHLIYTILDQVIKTLFPELVDLI